MRNLTLLMALPAALGLAACGQTTGERALTGAGAGAAPGAVAGEVIGDEAGTGAALGALGGAAIGAVTEEEDFDLGEPFEED